METESIYSLMREDPYTIIEAICWEEHMPSYAVCSSVGEVYAGLEKSYNSASSPEDFKNDE